MTRTLPLLLGVIAASGCGDNLDEGDSSDRTRLVCSGDGAECEDAWQDSLAAWLESGNDGVGLYTYSRSLSAPDGFRIVTEIDIEAGAPAARRASGVRVDAGSGALTAFEWAEVGDQIGIRSEGARPVSISTLYEECILDVLSRDASENEIVLERHASGELKACTFRPLDCAGSRSECVGGPTIDAINVAAR